MTSHLDGPDVVRNKQRNRLLAYYEQQSEGLQRDRYVVIGSGAVLGLSAAAIFAFMVSTIGPLLRGRADLQWITTIHDNLGAFSFAAGAAVFLLMCGYLVIAQWFYDAKRDKLAAELKADGERARFTP